MGLYERLLRPLLFRLPPETAHAIAHAGLHIPPLWQIAQPILEYKSPRLHLAFGGLRLPNPVGLAAGWDKNARAVGPLGRLGFGYLVVGTVTPEPRKGNPRPRVVRDVAQQAALNSLGFPNDGLEKVARRLRQSHGKRGDSPLLASIAANDIQGFVSCLETLQPFVDGVEVNISSPNTKGLRLFHDPDTFQRLLVELSRPRTKPLFVKLPPYQEGEGDNVFQLVRLCRAHDLAGVTVSNTLPVRDPRLAVGEGGLSGRPLLANTLRMVEEVRRLAGEGLAINASGGIFDGADALAALQRGADTVQVMTALWYKGPGVAGHLNRWLDHYLRQKGIASVQGLRAAQRQEAAGADSEGSSSTEAKGTENSRQAG